MNCITTVADRNNCSLVCRTFKEAERSTRYTLRLRSVMLDLPNVPTSFVAVRELDMSDCQPQWLSLTAAGKLEVSAALAAAFPSVKSLKAFFPDQSSMELVREVWPELEELTICGGFDSTRSRDVFTPSSDISVEPLPLRKDMVAEQRSEPPVLSPDILQKLQLLLPCIGTGVSLRKLVKPGARINDADLGVIARACPNLEHLEIQASRGVTDVGFAALGNCPLVLFYFEDLSAQFDCLETFTSEGVLSLVDQPQGKRLTSLRLGTYLSSEGAAKVLAVLAEHALCLRALSLGKTEQIPSEQLPSIAPLLERLADCNLSTIVGAPCTDEHLKLLAPSCKNLIRLHLDLLLSEYAAACFSQLHLLRELFVDSWEESMAVDLLKALRPLRGQLRTLSLHTHRLSWTLAELRTWPHLMCLKIIYEGGLEVDPAEPEEELCQPQQQPPPLPGQWAPPALLVDNHPVSMSLDGQGGEEGYVSSPANTAWRTPSPSPSSQRLPAPGSTARVWREQSPDVSLPLEPVEEADHDHDNDNDDDDAAWKSGSLGGVMVQPDWPATRTPQTAVANVIAGRMAMSWERRSIRQARGLPPLVIKFPSEGTGGGREGQGGEEAGVHWPHLEQFSLSTTHVGLADLRLLEGSQVSAVEIVLGTGLYLTEQVVRGYFSLLSSLPKLQRLRLNLFSDSEWFVMALGDAVLQWPRLQQLRLALTWRGPEALFERLLESPSLQLVDARFDSKAAELRFYRQLLRH